MVLSMNRLRAYLATSRFLTVAFFLCVFYTIDLAVGLTIDPTFLSPENLIESAITAILSGLFCFELITSSKKAVDH